MKLRQNRLNFQILKYKFKRIILSKRVKIEIFNVIYNKSKMTLRLNRFILTLNLKIRNKMTKMEDDLRSNYQIYNLIKLEIMSKIVKEFLGKIGNLMNKRDPHQL